MELRDVASAGVFLAGTGVYALLQGPGGVDFDVTPLVVGVIAIVAGLASTRRRTLATGLVLAGWGAAVRMVSHDVVPRERTTPAYMLGIAVGLAATALAAPKASRGGWLTSGVVASFLGPLGLYLTFDVEALGRWPAWAATLVVMACWELIWALRASQDMGEGGGDGAFARSARPA